MDIHKLQTPAELTAMKSLRYEVFVNEQQVDPHLESDVYDTQPTTQYIGAFIDDQLVGVLRLRPVGSSWKLQRIAVRKKYRHLRIGTQLLNFVKVAAQNENIETLFLHAQTQAIDFYLKQNFKIEGEVFQEASIDHMKVAYPLNRT